MRREWKTEWIKLRYRRVGLTVLAFLGLIILWIVWILSRNDVKELEDGYQMLFMNLPLIDTILMPTMIAMLGSRLCDAEVKGDTLKLLCTMEKKSRLFDMKLLTGAFYLAVFVLAQAVQIFLTGRLYGFSGTAKPVWYVYFVLQIYTVSMLILLLQVVLSFFFENQILPLAAGLFGSFVGLFSWFFPNSNPLKLLFLWAYYSQLGFMAQDWDETTRISTFYDVPFPFPVWCLVLVLFLAGYLAGKQLFLRKEI